MTGHGEKLSRKQEAAIAALLGAPTVAAAAVQAGVGERTLRRWVKEPDFRAAHRNARCSQRDPVGHSRAGGGRPLCRVEGPCARWGMVTTVNIVTADRHRLAAATFALLVADRRRLAALLAGEGDRASRYPTVAGGSWP